jgi:hypothetical protein
VLVTAGERPNFKLNHGVINLYWVFAFLLHTPDSQNILENCKQKQMPQTNIFYVKNTHLLVLGSAFSQMFPGGCILTRVKRRKEREGGAGLYFPGAGSSTPDKECLAYIVPKGNLLGVSPNPIADPIRIAAAELIQPDSFTACMSSSTSAFIVRFTVYRSTEN